MASLLVVAPIQSEYDSILAHWQRRGLALEPVPVGRLPAVRASSVDLILSVGGLGKAQFAVQSQHLLENGSWDGLVCVGAAGSLCTQVQIGDLVVATDTLEHDFRTGFSDRPRPRFPAAGAFLTELQALSARYRFALHAGTVVSGDEDIIDPERRAELEVRHNALAAAWEGAGGARAARFSGVPFVELRGITDSADEGAAAAFRQNLPNTMESLAALLLAWGNHRRWGTPADRASSPHLSISPMVAGDIAGLTAAFAEMNKERSQYERYWVENGLGERTTLVARQRDTVVGYTNILWRSVYPPFQRQGIPEINDMNVVMARRQQGIGSALVTAAEEIARNQGHQILGIGVGVTPDYAIAQSLYPRLGYVHDGQGIHPDPWGGAAYLTKWLGATSGGATSKP